MGHFIHGMLDALDLQAFYACYKGDGFGNQSFHPAMMVKMLVYATDVFSSRKIKRRLHEEQAFRMLAAGNFPRYRTINDFRALHLKKLSELFARVLRFAREMGLPKLGAVAIDGTKVTRGVQARVHGTEPAVHGRDGRVRSFVVAVTNAPPGTRLRSAKVQRASGIRWCFRRAAGKPRDAKTFARG